jgi:hypothetical protein
MILDVTKSPFNAKGDGKTDDTNAIQKALDAIHNGVNPKTGDPVLRANVLPQDHAICGGTVYFPEGRTFVITKPLHVWGMTTIKGAGKDTMIDGRAIPKDRGLFELSGVSFGDAPHWNGNAKFQDFSLMSGGHAFCSQPDRPGDPLGTVWRNLQIASRGWGLYFPNSYAQSVTVEDIDHVNPCSGGIVMRGNLNYFKAYGMIRGYGGWDGQQGFESPWTKDKLAQIDIGGEGNTVINCHVEHGSPEGPENAVVPFAFRNGYVHVINNWPEFQRSGALFDNIAILFDNCTPTGQWWRSGKVRYNNAGRLYIPQLDTNFAGCLSTLIDALGDTEITVGLHRGYWGTDLPKNVIVQQAEQYNIFGSTGQGKRYNPNPKGQNLLANPLVPVPWTLNIGSGGKATMEVSSDGLTVTIDVTKRPDSGGIGACYTLPVNIQPMDWVLYSADMDCDSDAIGWPQWWTDYPNFNVSNTNRTKNGCCSSPLPNWKAGMQLQLAAFGLGKHTFKNIAITPL